MLATRSLVWQRRAVTSAMTMGAKRRIARFISSEAAKAALIRAARRQTGENSDSSTSAGFAGPIAAGLAAVALCCAMDNAAPTLPPHPNVNITSPTVRCETMLAAPQRPRLSNRRSNNQARNVMLHRMRSVKARFMGEKYKVDWKQVLGEGAYGSVHPARLAATGEKVALKKISKRYTNSSSFKTETDALLRIYDNGGHPNISGLRDIYEDFSHFYLIMDLVSGGEMFEHLIDYGAYSEAEAARLMLEVASALAFIHGVGVVHADLKPENLLLCSKKRDDGTIKMIDFGCAVVSDDSDEEEDYEEEGTNRKKGTRGDEKKDELSTGTTAYWPPERFRQGANADPATDMWAVGIILFIMLTGVHPFDVTGMATDDQIEEHIKSDPAPPIGPEFTAHLSPSAIDLIQKLMAKDPNDRLTAEEMLQHPWVTGDTASTDTIVDSDKKLSRFKDLRNKVEAGIFAVLVSHGHRDTLLSEGKPTTQIKTKKSGGREDNDAPTHIMKRAFEVFDAEGKGFVTPDDLGRVASVATGSKVSSSDTQEMLEATLDARGDADNDASSGEIGLSLSDFSKLFSGLKHKHFPRGHVIFRAGDDGDAMYFLNSGKVEIQTRKGQLVSILRHGDFFGEGSLLDEHNQRFTTAKCATPVDVIKIKRQDFDRYVASSSTAKNHLMVKWRARNLAYAKNLIRLQTNVKARRLKKGDVVYKEGDVSKSMYLIDENNGGELEAQHGGVTVHSYLGGDSFGESSLLFSRPRSSTVKCVSDTCNLHEMRGEDFIALVESSPEMAASLRDMCRKRLFKKAVKAYNLEKSRGLSDDDLVQAFYDADVDKSGNLSLDEVRRLMHRMDPNFPEKEIVALLKFVDIDEDGHVGLEEFKRLFRCFDSAEESWF